jgi:hypothetical protein
MERLEKCFQDGANDVLGGTQKISLSPAKLSPMSILKRKRMLQVAIEQKCIYRSKKSPRVWPFPASQS